ncbi:MAG: glutaredoxin, partial [Chrysiogenales bacterium]
MRRLKMELHERFEIVNGTVDIGDVTVYALSTCGFCKRALSFLRENSVKFRYLYIDDLPPDEKAEIRKAISEKFNREIRYPFLIF